MEQWQDAASQQLRLLTSRLNELLTKGLEWLRSELGVDLGLKPELIPPWIILLAACSGLLLMAVLWASVCRTVFRKRPAVRHVDDGVDGKRTVCKPMRAEEPKKKKKAEKKAQPNGRAVAEAQEGVTACEERVPHHQPPPPQVKTDKVAETKKSKKKAKAAVKETKAATGDGKEPEEGTWETKVSNKEKREQRKKDKNSSDSSASPGGGDTPVNTPADQPKASAAPPAPANQKKKKGESAKVKAEKAETVVSQAISSAEAATAAAATDTAVKVAPQSAAPKTSSWTTQRQTASLWRASPDEPWAVPLPSAELNLVSLSGLGVAQPQPVSDLSWLSQPRVDDEWSGLNGGSADPSSDWNAPSEAWGNYEEPPPEAPQAPEPPLPEPAKVNLTEVAEDDEDKDKGDATTDGATKAKKKKKKKKKTSEEGETQGKVEEPVKEMAPAVSAKKLPPVQENAAVQPVKAAAVEARGDRPVKDVISQKPPVTQVPQKPTDGEPAGNQNNLPAPLQQKKTEESQVPKPAKKKKARRET